MSPRRKKHEEEEEKVEEGDEGASGWLRFFGSTEGVRRSVTALFMFAFSVFVALSYLSQAGVVGEWVNTGTGFLIGWGKWVFPLLLLAVAWFLLQQSSKLYYVSIVAITISFIALLGILHVFVDPEEMREVAVEGRSGGYIGFVLAAGMVKMFGFVAAMIFLAIFFFAGILIAFGFSLIPFFEAIRLTRRKSERDREEKEREELEALERDMLGVEEEGQRNDLEGKSGGESHVSGGENDEVALEGMTSEDLVEKEEDPDEEAKKNGVLIQKITFEDDRQKNIKEGKGGVGELEEKEILEQSREEGFDDEDQDEEDEDEFEEGDLAKQQRRRPKKRMTWKLPPAGFLEESEHSQRVGDVEEKRQIIVEALADFKIEVEPVDEKIGPTVTQFRFRPARGVKLEKILGYSSNLAYALAAQSIRIEAPIPGETLIGIEVPNATTARVGMRDAIKRPDFRQMAKNGELPIALGKDVTGEYVFGSLAKMPHLLVAGSTGSGKSVCINTLILSLLYGYAPDELSLILVDPKQVELTPYQDIPHLKVPVIVDMKKVVGALRWAVSEMEKRYGLLREIVARDIRSYNDKIYTGNYPGKKEREPLPFVVIVVEEFSDLMMSHGKEVEGLISRLAQKSRAVGIHLVISAQNPTVEVVTGLIKSNITSRIAFKVASQMYSRTILDRGGAEKLLGRGDMLYSTAERPKPQRIQGIYVSEEEVANVVEYLIFQKPAIKEREDENENQKEDENELEEAMESEEREGKEGEYREEKNDELDLDAYVEENSRDNLYDSAKAIVIQAGEGSASLLQRRLNVGYNRASNLLDALQDEGIVGPKKGSKPREVLVGPHAMESSNTDMEENM